MTDLFKKYTDMKSNVLVLAVKRDHFEMVKMLVNQEGAIITQEAINSAKQLIREGKTSDIEMLEFLETSIIKQVRDNKLKDLLE
jgi:hypothetical protein